MTNKLTKSVNKIKWESWNEKEEEYLQEKRSNDSSISKQFGSFKMDDSDEDSENVVSFGSFGGSPTIITPFGVFSTDSMLKPTDRWNCWIGHTNFSITMGMVNKLDKHVDGVAVLNVLDRYTFVVGISKSFNWSLVRQDIEKKLNAV